MTQQSQQPAPHANALDVLDAAYDRRPPFEDRLVRSAKRVTKHRAQRLLWLIIAAAGLLTRPTRRQRAHLPALQPGNPQIRRILLVRLDLIGDVILTLPAARALQRAYPDAQIDLLVQPSTAPVLAGERHLVSHIHTANPYRWLTPGALVRPSTWREALALTRALRAQHYDLAISVSGDMNSILTRLSGARRRVGYAGEAYPFLLTDPIPGARYRRHQHEVRYVLALAQAAGATIQPADHHLQLTVTPEATASAGQLIQRARQTTGARGPIVAIHVGARNGQAKRWPPAHIAALAHRVIANLDALVLLTGAPNEVPLARAVLHHAATINAINSTRTDSSLRDGDTTSATNSTDSASLTPRDARTSSQTADDTTALRGSSLIQNTGDNSVLIHDAARNTAPITTQNLANTIVNLTGQTTIPELIALIAASDLLVSGDSGPMHIASAVHTPIVALHGPTDPGLSGPTSPDAIVLRRALWCSPCYDASATAECRFDNPVCMKQLTPDLVYAAVQRQLARHATASAAPDQPTTAPTRATPQEGAHDATPVSLPSHS